MKETLSKKREALFYKRDNLSLIRENLFNKREIFSLVRESLSLIREILLSIGESLEKSHSPLNFSTCLRTFGQSIVAINCLISMLVFL